MKDASVAISVSTKMVRLLIASGRLKAVNLGKRMTRISLQELTDFAQGQGRDVVLPSPFPPFNNDKREKKKPDVSAKPETGNVNKRAKCRMTPASDIAPEGVTHDSYYTLAEVMRKFGIKYGRFYEVRNRFQLPSVCALPCSSLYLAMASSTSSFLKAVVPQAWTDGSWKRLRTS